ncbi:hypothetical protein [Edaphobacter dinghuensis]|uniref:Uncharacterized protein n=1 Tax=Edaphobacter dinghuensis TaxID=1560005 RepID=A0A917H2R9_9BACT|nr:hypothetical protein [Edaphobacter dinghuensis]GGG65146.1 hypothetical protein GCM10011585_03480 [Edaphobacter dinghuensis]
MSIEAQTVLAGQVVAAAQAAGLAVVSSVEGKDFSGGPTTRFTLGLASDPSKTQVLELSAAFDFSSAALAGVVKEYLAEAAKRLKSARPDCYLTLGGLPLSFGKFEWPFHASTSGADTSLVHGEVWLEDGNERLLHSKIAASMTVTFREVVAAPEQPFAESFIYNAVRKTMDQGQLELVKSGNRQPVPVTTRYYSSKRKVFVFNDTTEAQQKEFLAAKTYWLSGVLGGGAPVWLVDPRDAQYLDTTLDQLKKLAKALAAEGLIQLAADGEYATSTATLLARNEQYAKELADALAFTKPTFNEEMRGGHTNM